MTEKSIPEKITDEFIMKVIESGMLDDKQIKSLEEIMNSEDAKKDDIVAIIERGIDDENQ